jgi:hypothetical protein
MNKVLFGLCFLIAIATFPHDIQAQGVRGKSFGFGLQLGEPTAITFRMWTSKNNSWDAAIGQSYLGSPHIHAGYLWHFWSAFNSRIVFLYAGVGGAIGLGKKDGGVLFSRSGKNKWYDDKNDKFAFAARGVMGINVIPERTPLDIFFEIDPLIGVIPDFGFDFMASLGIRFYP